MLQYNLTKFIGISFFMHIIFAISTANFPDEIKKELPLQIRLIEIPEVGNNYIPKPPDALLKEIKETVVFSSETPNRLKKISAVHHETVKTSKPIKSLPSLFTASTAPLKEEIRPIESDNKITALNNPDSRIHPKTDIETNEKSPDSDTVSLDTKEVKYSSYFDSIKKKIYLVWKYPDEAKSQGISGNLILMFFILKDGTLLDVKLLKPTKHHILDEEAMRAVKSAAPFGVFPSTINKNQLNIVATFSYKPDFVSQDEMM